MLKISIITVCYNMEEYIEQTILSILNQNYQNLEYIVIDGGSTDNTCSIIEKYRNRIAYFVSESDNGMYDALSKGFSHATGDVVAWLNADDLYYPWALNYVNRVFTELPEVKWICGIPSVIDNDGLPSRLYTYPGAKNRIDIADGKFNANGYGYLQQEGMFWRRCLYEEVNGLDRNLRLAGDFDLWMRFAERTALYSVCVPLAMFRRRDDSLSASEDKYKAEVMAILSAKKAKNSMTFPAEKETRQKALRRLLVRKKSPLIVYLPKKKRFHVFHSMRTVACFSYKDAIIFSMQMH